MLAFEASAAGMGGSDLSTAGSCRRVILRKLSCDESETTEDALEDFPKDGVRSFQAATILRTDARGVRGEVGVRGSCLPDETAVEYMECVSVRAGESNDDRVGADLNGEIER